MKKSIVLLVSLLFITAISALIFQNLDDTESYINEQNYKINKIQLLAISKNMQRETSEAIIKHGNNLEDFSNSFEIEGIKITFSLNEYEKKDVNNLVQSGSSHKDIKNLFINDNVGDFESFKNLVKNRGRITNNKQLNAIIEDFIKETYNKKIISIKHKLGFYENLTNSYELKIKIENLKDFIKAYYILDNRGEVKYFELSFK